MPGVAGGPGFRGLGPRARLRAGTDDRRIDPDGNYEPANCRWILSAENTRRAGRLLDGPNADDIEARLTAYARQTGKSRNFIIGEALSAYLRKVQP